MERLILIQTIQSRLATLESDREEARLNGKCTDSIDVEIKELRLKYKDAMNTQCPLIKD